ncbi:MAG: FmdB family transcriptional regulator [Actinomycetota bacterium]|nr:FmdB family transcriptional regulator [Euzebyales bacterium]MDQ3342765.1 FmdB family transcriptional regulator [Actinomycetota bacterium]MDQ3528478.1 FmdB family transcriptional regulator [Actinomycetota bacterium]
MPTYEYACRDCGEHVEVVQSFRDDALTVCGLCGGRLRKVFSAAGIVFKGSGYYVNDSRKRPASEGEGSEGKRSDKSDKADKKEVAKADSAKSDGKSDSDKSDSGKPDRKNDTSKKTSTSAASAESA